MLELVSLTFNNIGRFTTEQTINFSNKNKLVQIDGKNINTGGSSGAAKTTVISALEYLLGTNDTPTTILQSRLTNKHMYVQGEFLDNGRPVSIRRDKKEGLSITTVDETISKNNKIAEEKLDQIIKIPRKLFRKMIHKHQKEGGFFLNLTAQESYKFLIKVLGLEEYLTQNEKITEDVKNLKLKLSAHELNVTSACTSLGEFKTIRDSKKQPECNIDENNIREINTECIELDRQINELLTYKQSELSLVMVPVKKPFNFDNSTLISLRTQLDALYKQKTTIINNIANKKSSIKDTISTNNIKLIDITNLKEKAVRNGTEIQKLKKEVEILQQAICPTCRQTWVGDSIVAKIEEYNNKINKLIQETLQFKNSITEESKIREEIISYNKELIELSSLDKSQEIIDLGLKIEQIEGCVVQEQAKELNVSKEANTIYLSEKSDYINATNAIEDKYKDTVNGLKDKLTQSKALMSEYASTYRNYQSNLNSYTQEMIKLTQLIEGKEKLLSESQAKKDELNKQTLIAEEALRLIKVYTLQIFQETLDTVGEIASQTLNHIPNMSSATIYFEGCKENQNGTIKDEVNAVINMDGENDISIKSLSGGERTAIDLAVDLAVIDVLESKTGQGADFFILDEPFDGLDGVCREQCLEILKQIDTNKRIIIIDHCAELKQLVTDVITVVREGENSSVE